MSVCVCILLVCFLIIKRWHQDKNKLWLEKLKTNPDEITMR